MNQPETPSFTASPTHTQARYRVLIVEDHTIVRQGLVALLSTSPEIEVIADVGDGLLALEVIERHQPEILLCDLAIPGLGGIEVITRASAKGVKAIALSMHHDGVWINRAIEAGAWGYLVKGSGVQDVIKAILAVGRGERFLSPTAQIAANRPQLTTREREILTFVAQGHTSKEISGLLTISPRTVEHHRANLMEKLGINDVAGLTRYAVRQGIVDPLLK